MVLDRIRQWCIGNFNIDEMKLEEKFPISPWRNKRLSVSDEEWRESERAKLNDWVNNGWTNFDENTQRSEEEEGGLAVSLLLLVVVIVCVLVYYLAENY